MPMTSLIRRLPFADYLLPTAVPALAAAPQRAAPKAPRHLVAAPMTTGDTASLDELRGDAMRRLFPKLYMWWGSRREWGVALHAHAYLAEATTVEELERRIRRIERQQHFRH
jgi:hypothetical protein